MKKLTMTFTALLALGLTGSALAGSGGTVVSAYGGKGGAPVGSVLTHHQGPVHTAGKHAGTLPFTGLDLTVFAALALLLIVLGILLVRSSRSGHETT